jgi:hypothetical protein
VRRLLFAFLCVTGSIQAGAIFINDATQMNTSTDYVNWVTAYGPDQTSVSQNFFVSSSWNDSILANLANGPGKILVGGKDWAVSPSASSDTGIVAKDDLLSAGTEGGGPLTLNFRPTYGVGTFVQADGHAQFTARIQAYAGINSVLDMTVSSDAYGDAVFLGVADTLQEITKVVLSLTQAPVGYKTGDFVVDTLYIQTSPFVAIVPPPPPDPLASVSNPEPSTFGMFAIALLGIAGRKFRKHRSA